MRPLILAFAASCVSVQIAAAEPCPSAPDHSAALSALMEQVQAAPNDLEARKISNQMWEYWADAPNEQAQAILDRGMTQRAGYNFAGAITEFNRLIEYCPDYAEGYNQRAFVNYLRQDFAAAVVDLDRAISLSPDHIAAISGRALSLLGLGRKDAARADLTRALELNPWLSERGLMAPGGPLAPPGQDI